MSVLTDYTLTIATTPFPPDDFTFSVVEVGYSGSIQDASRRDQIGNPVFDGDYNNDPFETGITYEFLAYSPTYQKNTGILRGRFDASGTFNPLTADESPTGTTATGLPANLTSPVTNQPLVVSYNNTLNRFEQVNKTLGAIVAAASDSDIAVICSRLSAIGCAGSGSGDSGAGTPYEVLDEPHCFDEPVLAILDAAIRNSHYQTGSVSYDKTDFITTGANLFNKDSAYNKAGFYITDAGLEIVSADYSISHTIPVSELTTYTPSYKGFVAYYNQVGTLLGGERYDRATDSFTTPSNCVYIQLTVPTESLDTFMLAEGESLPDTYESFRLLFRGETLAETTIRQLGTLSNLLATYSDSRFTPGKNLFNKDSSANTPNFYIDDAGTLHADSSYTVSHIIKVSASTYYTPTYRGYVTYYNALGAVVGGATFERATDKFQTSSATAYIRLTVPTSQLASFQLESGSTATSYASYAPSLTAITPQGTAATITAVRAKTTSDTLQGLLTMTKNLFNKADPANIANFYIDNLGVLHADSDNNVSHYIAVSPSTWYTPSYKTYVTFYNSELAVTGSGAMFDRSTDKFQTDANTAYIRITVPDNRLDTFQLEVGSTATDPVPFTPTANLITPQATDAYDMASEALPLVQSISPLFVSTQNLFNKDDSDNVTGQYMDTAGTLHANAGFLVSDFIPVLPSTTYTPSDKQYITLFNASKGVISSSVGDYARGTDSITTTSLTSFVKLTVPVSLLGSFLFAKGNTLPADQPYGQILKTPATGKRILWLGTSIPAGTTAANTFADRNSYPGKACALVGATCINQAIPSSTIRIKDKNGTYADMNWQNAAYSLGHTAAEKASLISNWSTIRTQFANAGSAPSTLSSADQAFITACSYENRLVPYLDGTYPAPDAIVFSHGYNDVFPNETASEYYSIPSTYNDRNTFLGAMNYIIDVIHSYKPRMKIIIEGHYENQKYPRVAQAQQVLADYWQFPLWKLWAESGLSQRKILGTQALWATAPYSSYTAGVDTSQDMTALRVALADEVHFSSDPTGKATEEEALLVRNHLNETF